MQILVSIGLNPLPVLIAVRRLAQLHPGATFRFLLSRDEELDGILDLLKNVKVGISHKLIPLGDPKSPREIMEKIQKSFAGETGPIHFHFTGGTKPMVLYAARALAKSGERFTTSYISAEAHTLIGSNLMSGEDVLLGIPDERTDLLLDFEQIARLHCHTMRYRVRTRFGQYEVGDGPRKNNFLPSRR
ncbi:MAG: hypothetical protein JNL98_37180, partial [Bryobacterales bacterium]|nr:hypothetical protein [Bryobacterales bacterium]